MAKKESYIGRVQNTGAQRVEAPYQPGKKDTGKVRRSGGADLRDGIAGRGKKRGA